MTDAAAAVRVVRAGAEANVQRNRLSPDQKVMLDSFRGLLLAAEAIAEDLSRGEETYPASEAAADVARSVVELAGVAG
jgi:hypothetical protein